MRLAPSDDGSFALPLPADRVGLELVVEAAQFDEEGATVIRVAEAEDSTSLVTHRFWSWTFPVCETGCPSAVELGELTITEGAGSGAAHVFDWIADTHARVAAHPSMRAIAPPSVLVLWRDGIEPDCRSCYVPTEVGGAEAAVGGAIETFGSAIRLSGAAARPSQWSPSTIAHEASHWVMEGYSRWPNDLSFHDPSRLTRPGVAYTEGWATFNGQATLRAVRGTPDPIARFGDLVVDLDRATVNDVPVEAPSADGALDQWVTETTVAAVLWTLLAEAGDEALIAALRSPRLLDADRGYERTDLLDLLDALVCDGLVDEADVARVASARGVPWRPGEVLCL